ncbi:MAG TPA: glycine--tRNA ligase [Candidatus Paceibacterota bacterium]|nr:glycine--tRNA ligase [Candidatus Paceibacterota bacterium]
MDSQNQQMEKIISLTKRRGFIYQGSEIYGGLAGTWDYGPLGVQLKRNIANLWWRFFVEQRQDMYGVDSAILMNPKVWVASGHVDTFNDPLIEDVKTKKRYRLDHVLEENGINPEGKTLDEMAALVKEKGIKSPEGNDFGAAAQFNLMFKTYVGPVQDETSVVYLRPETAQGMFTNFRNVVDSLYPDLPFGLAQIGKSFRNEIAPRDFIFRVRELEIMEFEYFINPENWEAEFEKCLNMSREWFKLVGLPIEKVHEREIPETDRAHYSKRTVDFEFAYPFGIKEIGGIAYRTDFDLSNHERASGRPQRYTPKEGGTPFVPHVIEPTFGLDRHVLAVLANAYTEDEMNGETRVFLKLPPQVAPVKIAVFPLLKNKPQLVEKAQAVFMELKKEFGMVVFDDNGNIGKRYRRQDEIGTPYCVTVDFDSLEDGTVTVRDRDTGNQERVAIAELSARLKQ